VTFETVFLSFVVITTLSSYMFNELLSCVHKICHCSVCVPTEACSVSIHQALHIHSFMQTCIFSHRTVVDMNRALSLDVHRQPCHILTLGLDNVQEDPQQQAAYHSR
jgi:hypothetical protein